VRCALENSASVAKTFLQASVVIHSLPEPEGAAGAGAMSEMGGY
jgi:hypothetical protein